MMSLSRMSTVGMNTRYTMIMTKHWTKHELMSEMKQIYGESHILAGFFRLSDESVQSRTCSSTNKNTTSIHPLLRRNSFTKA
jgi:hypothetical protein